MEANDGEIGKAKDFFFDDHAWKVRHLVVDTGKWLPGRKVLISPQALLEPDRENKLFRVDLTCDQIKHSPSIDLDKPVSRQHQIELFEYYSWTPYWGAGMVGPFPEPGVLTEENLPPELDEDVEGERKHIRSMREVTGYHLVSGDEKIAKLSDFIVEDGSWIVRYVAVRTHVHFSGVEVLLSPDWIEEIDWETKRIETDLSRDQILEAPPFDSLKPIDREYEAQLHEHYGRTKYWE